MGRTYVDSHGRDFDVNFAGAAVLGKFHEKAGVGLYEKDSPFASDWPPSTKFSMSAEETLACADALDRIDKQEFFEDLQTNFPGYLDSTETLEEFSGWLQEWVDWLRNSGGYKVDG